MATRPRDGRPRKHQFIFFRIIFPQEPFFSINPRFVGAAPQTFHLHEKKKERTNEQASERASDGKTTQTNKNSTNYKNDNTATTTATTTTTSATMPLVLLRVASQKRKQTSPPQTRTAVVVLPRLATMELSSLCRASAFATSSQDRRGHHVVQHDQHSLFGDRRFFRSCSQLRVELDCPPGRC